MARRLTLPAAVMLALGLGLRLGCGGGGTTSPAPTALQSPPPPPPPAQACSAPAAASTLTASVKDPAFGAKGDGVTDDTAAIQRAVDFVAGTGGTVTFPGGVYMVNAVTGISVMGGMTLQLSADTVLKAIPNSAQTYSILTVGAASGVNILGGTFQGDYGTPVTHTGTGGEWGMGITLSGSRNVVIMGVTAMDCWGDGFYVESGASGVSFCSVTATHNRRNGLTLVSADTVSVRNSVFMNTGGTLPEDGLDIEPNPGDTVSNVAITGCTLMGNAGDGIQDGVDLASTGAAFVTGVSMDSNSITGNGADTLSTVPRNGIEISNCSGHVVTGNVVSGNAGDGIQLRDGATGMTVTGNTVESNSLHGIWDTAGGNTISGNTVSGNGLTP